MVRKGRFRWCQISTRLGGSGSSFKQVGCSPYLTRPHLNSDEKYNIRGVKKPRIKLPWRVLVSNTAKWPWALLLFLTFLASRHYLLGSLCHWKRRAKISGTFLSTLGLSWY